MATETLLSDSVIILPQGADLYEDAFKELGDMDEFKRTITYRRYDFDEDNTTGDKDKSTYNDYTISAEVQVKTISERSMMFGQLQVGDAILFIHREVKLDSDGTAVSTAFRPQINDEFLDGGIWYRIVDISPDRVGISEVYMECGCKRIRNLSPTVAYNQRYEVPGVAVPGRGFS